MRALGIGGGGGGSGRAEARCLAEVLFTDSEQWWGKRAAESLCGHNGLTAARIVYSLPLAARASANVFCLVAWW